MMQSPFNEFNRTFESIDPRSARSENEYIIRHLRNLDDKFRWLEQHMSDMRSMPQLATIDRLLDKHEAKVKIEGRNEGIDLLAAAMEGMVDSKVLEGIVIGLKKGA